jgi:hypothetical protein
MELPFPYHGHRGRVIVTIERTRAPAALGARGGARGLPNCTATVEFSASGYLGLVGWVQLVCSTDNASHGRQFEIDPFDPFELYKRVPTPYGWYGITPTLFDARSRERRAELDWVAHSFLAASPLDGNRRSVTPLLGFSWGSYITGHTRWVIHRPINK